MKHVAGRALARYMIHVGFLLDLFFHLEDGGDMFLRNIGSLLIN
jgi:hypothetical protein